MADADRAVEGVRVQRATRKQVGADFLKEQTDPNVAEVTTLAVQRVLKVLYRPIGSGGCFD